MAKKEVEVPADVPAVGQPAPDFELTADDGSTVRLRDLRGQRIVLYFYPKDDTPGCTTQACGFRDNYVEIQERNALVLGISPDGEKSHAKFKTKFNLPFKLLADPEHRVAHFLIDEQGNVADAQYSVSPEASVEGALAALRLS